LRPIARSLASRGRSGCTCRWPASSSTSCCTRWRRVSWS